MGKKADKTGPDSYSWPGSFHAYAPGPKAAVDCLLENQIYTVANFFSPQVCNDLIAWFTASLEHRQQGKRIEFEETEFPPKKGHAARVNDRAVLMDPQAAVILWKQLKSVLTGLNHATEYYTPEPLDDPLWSGCRGLADNIRVYRYQPGHYFGQHYDESKPVHYTCNNETVRGKTRWTLLIYLTGADCNEVAGGETRFFDDYGNKTVEAELVKGMALLHKHGRDCMLHEGAPVKAGYKWILRSDLVY